MKSFKFTLPVGGVLEYLGREFTHQGDGVFIGKEAPGILEGNLPEESKSSWPQEISVHKVPTTTVQIVRRASLCYVRSDDS